MTDASMQFIAYDAAATVPNIVVDGAAAPGTVLTLSHWPKSGTPAALRADTSAEIVFNYLDTPSVHVDVDAVSNNHFDEDGLIGIFTLVAARPRVTLAGPARRGRPRGRLRGLSIPPRGSHRVRARGVRRPGSPHRCREPPSPARTETWPPGCIRRCFRSCRI